MALFSGIVLARGDKDEISESLVSARFLNVKETRTKNFNPIKVT